MSNKIVINLATLTNDKDAKNNSCVDGVKQAATLGFVPAYFLIMKWDMIMEKKPNFNIKIKIWSF